MRTNKLILGTVQMGLNYGVNNSKGKIEKEEADKIFKSAYESGITLLDTAEAYGNAHQIIGDFHALNPEIRFKVITKVPPIERLTNVEDKIEHYLKVMNISQLEGFMFHSFESYKDNQEIISKLSSLKKEGLLKQIGVSVYTNDELQTLLSDGEIELIQMPFNLLDNFGLRGKLMKEAKKKGKTIHTRSTFLQGLFFKDLNDNHPVVKALKQELCEIYKLSESMGVSIATLALAYCNQQTCIDQVLIGVDSVDQLRINLYASNCYLPENAIQIINQININNIKLLNPSLWGDLIN